MLRTIVFVRVYWLMYAVVCILLNKFFLLYKIFFTFPFSVF